MVNGRFLPQSRLVVKSREQVVSHLANCHRAAVVVIKAFFARLRPVCDTLFRLGGGLRTRMGQFTLYNHGGHTPKST